MILIKKFKKIIPSFRHKKVLDIFDNSYVYRSELKNIKSKSLIKRKKKYYCTKPTLLYTNILKYTDIIVKNVYYDFKPYKKYLNSQTLSGFTVTIPGVEYLNVGKIIYHYSFFNDFRNKFFFKGFAIQLDKIPLISVFSNVSNKLNNKLTFAKASGTYCTTKKTKKTKKKLIQVVLPSTQEILLSKLCVAYIGQNTNLKLHELIEGKCGFSFYKKKKIKVRGVAMNPVDHPNGGRTKTVQPERSPWNWIAKKKK